MAEAAEDAAYAKATGRPLKSFLLGLTAGGYIALGFVFFVTSQVGADQLSWGAAKVLGGSSSPPVWSWSYSPARSCSPRRR
jgi:formate transporter